MPNSINPAVLDSRMHLMGELKAGRACRWTTSPDRMETQRLARRIREALYIASLYPDRYPELATAHTYFAVHVVGPGVVEAKPRNSGPPVKVESAAPQVATHGQQVHGQEPATVGATTAQDLIDVWLKHLPSSDPLHFQQTSLPIDELYVLHSWVEKQRPKMMILLGEGFITLSLLEAGMETFAWHPPVPPRQGPTKELDL